MLQKQVITVPISQGLDLKTDDKQVMAGKSLQLENVRFYKTGKIQKRFGLTPIISTTDDGALNNPFAIVSDEKTMNILTQSGVYSLTPGASQWDRMSGMKDIVKAKSSFMSKSALNHYGPDMDYNTELGLIVTVYRELLNDNALAPSPSEYVTIVLEDINTGVKKVRKIDTATTQTVRKAQQKVVITNNGGVPTISVFFDSTLFRLRNIVLDKNLNDIVPENTVETFVVATFARYKLDICRDGSNIYLGSMVNNSLNLRKYTLGCSIVSTYSGTTTNALGFNTTGTDYGRGFSICQTGQDVHVFFISTTPRVVGIGISKASMTISVAESSSTIVSSLRDISINANGSVIVMAVTETGPSVSNIERISKYTATFGASYVITEPSIFEGLRRAVIISRPFVINGVNYAVAKCPEASQTTGLIYNMDNNKFSTSFSPFGLSTSLIQSAGITGTCNSVVYLNKMFTMIEKLYGTETGSLASYDFTATIAASRLEMDYNDDLSSGTSQKVGDANYYTNGSTIVMDGRGAYESGFYLRPLIDSVTAHTGTANPNVSSKTFNYRAIYTFYNSNGEIIRSIPSPSVQVTTGANTDYTISSIRALPGSYKDKFEIEESFVSEVSLYRTTNNGTVFYKISSVSNSQFGQNVTIYDAASDTEISNNEQLYTTGGVLEIDPAPNAKFSTSGGNRLFLGGLEEEDEIAYSNKQIYGEEVSFSDFYRIRISSGTSADKSPMSALGYLDGKLIIFRKNSMYFIQGDGPNDTGAGGFFTDPEIISSDVGCTDPRSVVNGPNGLLFKSKKGIYLLDRSLQTSYIGAAVEDFNNERICSALVSDKQNEARFYTENGNCLVYNFLFDSWSTFLSQTPLNANIWNESPVSIVGGVVVKEVEDTYTDNSAYSMAMKTPWLKLSGLQDFARIYSLNILGEFKSAHTLRVTAYYDYTTDYLEVYNISPLVSDSQYQYRIHLKKQKCESVQFVIEDIDPIGESMTLSALTLEVGMKQGSMKLAATRKY